MLYIYQDFRGSTFTLESVNSIIVRTNYWSVFFMYSKMTTIPPTLLLVVRYMPLIFTIPCLSFLAVWFFIQCFLMVLAASVLRHSSGRFQALYHSLAFFHPNPSGKLHKAVSRPVQVHVSVVSKYFV